ncbi:MAG: hypothetical protein IGQ88_02380 [Gloeomargaritaceae cyanobacterium C42_A2020_066]|nr:hypothetical protein [Gloeomargaritaceae cyanobacterium C42_A2020_066]
MTAEIPRSRYLLRRISLLATTLSLVGTFYLGAKQSARASQGPDRESFLTDGVEDAKQAGLFTTPEASLLAGIAPESQSVTDSPSSPSRAEVGQSLDDRRPQAASNEQSPKTAGDLPASLGLGYPAQKGSDLNGQEVPNLTDASLPLGSGIYASSAQDTKSSNSPWKFEFTPYLWAPVNVDADLSTSRRTVSRNLTFSQITSAIDTPPLSGRFEAWKGNFGLLTEGYSRFIQV